MSLEFRPQILPVRCRSPSQSDIPLLPYRGRPEPDSDLDFRLIPAPAPIWSDLRPPRLRDERVKCERNLGWSIDWAVASIIKHLDKNAADISDTLRRLRTRLVHIHPGEGLGDVAYRAFNELDQTLFMGYLKDAVYLDIGSLGTDASGATYSHGRGPNHRVQRITLLLNADVHEHATPLQWLASLIHHMIHVYFLVACGPEEEKEHNYGRLTHGVQFAKVMQTIKKLTSTRGGRTLPLGFGHNLMPPAYYNEYYRLPARHQQSNKYCSNCLPDVDPISDRDIEKYYTKACKPLHDLPECARKSTVSIYTNKPIPTTPDGIEIVPRGEATPSIDSMEFIFQKRESVLVPTTLIDAFFTIRKAFSTRHLELDKKIPRSAFISLLQLLHTGTYAPDPTPVSSTPKSGPPVIKPYHSHSPPHILTDVRMFNLGVEAGFKDCQAIALDRLNTQYITREDPIQFLAAIYSGKDPHPDIRTWARRFLVQSPSSSSQSPQSWAMGGVGDEASEPPNLVKLETGMDLRERFFELVGRSAALEIDLLKARAWLARNGCYPWLSDGGERAMMPFLHPNAAAQRLPVAIGMGMGRVPQQQQMIEHSDRAGLVTGVGMGLDKYSAAGMYSLMGMGMGRNMGFVGMGGGAGSSGVGGRVDEWYV